MGIDCRKGRGIIMPGGKWDGACESFEEAAIRELEEETGLRPDNVHSSGSYLLGAPDGFGYFVMAFRVQVSDFTQMRARGSGVPQVANWQQFFASEYSAYYQLLFQIMSQAS